MSIVVAEEPRVLHAVPGRIRVHLPAWSGQDKQNLEAKLHQVQGVWGVQANPLTGNILIQFDPHATNAQTILQAVPQLDLHTLGVSDKEPAPPALSTHQGKTVRTRIAVRGMDRDPRVAKRVVAYLERRPGVRAHAHPLIGHVVVEFTEHETDLDDLICDVADMELPDLPGEDQPADPLDPGPLMQGTSRMIGSGLGLGLIATRSLVGMETPLPAAGIAAQTFTIIGILQSIPPIHFGLRKRFGRTVADLLLNIPAIVTLTLSEYPLGLAVTGSESLLLAMEVYARQRAWKRYEELTASAPSAQPDAVIRLQAGERTPLPGKVLEGAGTALGHDGMPLPTAPGSIIPPGARLFGGPFVLKLESEEAFQPFTPQRRPVSVAPSHFERYTKVMGPITLAYAAATAILTRSIPRTLAALLLVSPRIAVIGVDSADLGASARVLRAGVTVVGTRPHRMIRLPDCAFLDGGRLLTDKLEMLSALPLYSDCDSAELLARAAGVEAAAGSPWGGVFKTTETISATNGSFDGKTASAYAEGIQYTLGPVEDWSTSPEAARLRQSGNYVLVLRSQHEQRPLGVFALRPQLVGGIAELVQTCQRHGVELAVLADGDQIAVQALAQRAGVALLDSDDAVGAIRARQEKGAHVAFVSDQAEAAAAFDACDLAIGLSDERYRLPARADLLAPDFKAIAAIIEAGARRKAAVHDSMGLSVVSNIVAGVLGFLGLAGVAWALQAMFIGALAVLADSWIRLHGGERASSTATL